jgi:hypothetical protein
MYKYLGVPEATYTRDREMVTMRCNGNSFDYKHCAMDWLDVGAV